MPALALIVLALISLFAAALIEPPAAKAASRPKASAAAPSRADDSAGFKIVAEDISAVASARFVAVVLPRRIAESEIVRIAELARAKEKSPYEKTIVNFYLPGMKIGGGAWAIGSFQPSLKVSIIGLRLDEEQAAIAEAAGDRRDLVGVWLAAPPAPPGRFTIYREGTKTFGEWRLRNGQTSAEELIETHDSHGRHLTPIAGDGDYYLLTPAGELELRNDGTVFATAERLPGFGAKAVVKQPARHAASAARSRPARRASPATTGSRSLSQAAFEF